MKKYSRLITLGAIAPLPLVITHFFAGYFREWFIDIAGLALFYFVLNLLLYALVAVITVAIVILTIKKSIAEMFVAVGTYAFLTGLYVGISYIVQIGHSGHLVISRNDMLPFCKYLLATVSVIAFTAVLIRSFALLIRKRQVSVRA